MEAIDKAIDQIRTDCRLRPKTNTTLLDTKVRYIISSYDWLTAVNLSNAHFAGTAET